MRDLIQVLYCTIMVPIRSYSETRRGDITGISFGKLVPVKVPTSGDWETSRNASSTRSTRSIERTKKSDDVFVRPISKISRTHLSIFGLTSAEKVVQRLLNHNGYRKGL